VSRQYFGTDGIRGRTNQWPMTPDLAMKVGMAAGTHFLRGAHRHRVVIGKDTRLSGYMVENALVAGFTAVGMDVVQFGPIPTPAVALLAHSMRADLGVMISASHNPYFDNGIKLFGPDGYKLSDEDELKIEALIGQEIPLAPSKDIGRARRVEDARGRYIHAVKSSFPADLRLDGLKIVVDCANGAAYQVAPSALWELGATVVAVGVSPNGTNINDGCGSTSPLLCQETVVSSGADIGIALDGDADRLIVVDEKGQIVDGDQIMALIATNFARDGMLRGGGLVAPALHAVDSKTLPVLMRELSDLVRRTRAGSLRSSEMSDPTITVTNLGEQGVEAVMGVIYPPQVALVGFGRIAPRPVVDEADGDLRVLPAVTASLAADHRVSDGHRGALFLGALRELLQHPEDL